MLVPVLVPVSVVEPELDVSPLELSTAHVSPIVLSLLVPGPPLQKPSIALHASPSQHDASSMHHRSSASSGMHDGTHTAMPMPAAPVPAPGSYGATHTPDSHSAVAAHGIASANVVPSPVVVDPALVSSSLGPDVDAALPAPSHPSAHASASKSEHRSWIPTNRKATRGYQLRGRARIRPDRGHKERSRDAG